MTAIAGAEKPVWNRRTAVREALSGLVQVLVGPSSTGEVRWRAAWQRRTADYGLAVLTLATCAVSLASAPATMVGRTGSPFFSVVEWQPVPQPRNAAMQLVHEVSARPARFAAEVTVRPEMLLAMELLLALAVVAPLPLVLRRPMLGWRIAWLGLVLVPVAQVQWWGGLPWAPVQLPLLLIAFCVAGVGQPRSTLWWMWALSLGAWWWYVSRHQPGPLAGALGTAAFTAVALLVDGLGSRRRAQQALAEQAERTEAERSRRAVLEERARIARELHDVVAHHMALLAVRAESAPYRLGELSDPVRDEFAWLSMTAREAMADMRRLLAVLRQDQSAERAPQPQLSELPMLVEAAQRAGVEVALSMPPVAQRIPDGVGVCAYRIVQESLSNALRHAPGAPVTVAVAQDDGTMALRVANGPADPSAVPALADDPTGAHASGLGLTGMRERAALLGGSLFAGASPDGGFVVSAVLPLPDAA